MVEVEDTKDTYLLNAGCDLANFMQINTDNDWITQFQMRKDMSAAAARQVMQLREWIYRVRYGESKVKESKGTFDVEGDLGYGGNITRSGQSKITDVFSITKFGTSGKSRKRAITILSDSDSELSDLDDDVVKSFEDSSSGKRTQKRARLATSNEGSEDEMGDGHKSPTGQFGADQCKIKIVGQKRRLV